MATDRFFAPAIRLVEGLLQKFSVQPRQAMVRDEAEVKAWALMRGSAQLLLMVHSFEQSSWVKMIAPIASMAPHLDKLSLFQHLLETNAKSMRNAAFALMQDNIVVVSERPAQGLDAQEMEQMLKHVGAIADHYDDELAKEYGVEKIGRDP